MPRFSPKPRPALAQFPPGWYAKQPKRHQVSKWELFQAFANGAPLPSLYLQRIDSIEIERDKDAKDNNSYILTGLSDGVKVFIRVYAV